MGGRVGRCRVTDISENPLFSISAFIYIKNGKSVSSETSPASHSWRQLCPM